MVKDKAMVEACTSSITANVEHHHDKVNITRVHEGTTDTQYFEKLCLNHSDEKWRIVVSLNNASGEAMFH